MVRRTLGMVRRALGLPSRQEVVRWWIHRGGLADVPHARGRLTLLITGQSNAGNYGRAVPRHAERGVYHAYRGRLYEARDPLLGSDGLGTSPWIQVAEQLLRAGRAESVVLALAVRGGMAVRTWDAGGVMRAELRSRVVDLRALGLTPDYVLWQQGESDVNTKPEDYVASVRDVIAALRGDGVAAPVLIARASNHGAGATPRPRSAQMSLLDPSQGILPGPDTDSLGAELRYDDVHFSAAGQAALADLWVRAIVTASEHAQLP